MKRPPPDWLVEAAQNDVAVHAACTWAMRDGYSIDVLESLTLHLMARAKELEARVIELTTQQTPPIIIFREKP